MGYRRQRAYRLRFEDPDLAGLEVTARSLSIEGFMKVAGLAELAQGGGADRLDVGQMQEMLRAFASCLVGWNIEDLPTGDPVPATYEGVISQDLDFVMQIVMAWSKVIASVPPPLPDGSPAGGSAPEESTLQLASQSASLGS